LEGLWIDRFAVMANCWSWWGRYYGAVLGVSLALIVENAGTSSAVAGSGRERAAVLAASPSSGQRAASRDQADGNGSSGNQRTVSADRADQGDGSAGKDGEGRRDRRGRGKDNPARARAS